MRGPQGPRDDVLMIAGNEARERSEMKHRHREFDHPEKRGQIGAVARKLIRSCGIILEKTAEGVSGAVRVWVEPRRPDDHRRRFKHRRRKENR